MSKRKKMLKKKEKKKGKRKIKLKKIGIHKRAKIKAKRNMRGKNRRIPGVRNEYIFQR
jgi:hypothetical protein